MKLHGISNINRFDDGTDYLVSLELSDEEKARVAERHTRWENGIESATAHVWVKSGNITSVDLSVFDGEGDWEDCIAVETVLPPQAVEHIRKYVMEKWREEKTMSKIENYLECLNQHILPGIDYAKLDESYQTQDKAYAKGVLNLLHTAMVENYGSEYLQADYDHDEDGYVLIPGVIQGKHTGEIAIALLGIDLLSAGEHCETDILCRYGVLAQGHTGDLPPYITSEISARYMPYDYCYTAELARDIHISRDKLPDGIKEILGTYRDYTVELLANNDTEENDMER